ncbi:MAG: hypothetical protein ACRBG0_14120, partial [Lewinella sp.]|uniref:hypothetical protein n=1 Tax=Lewinella sp. TaxID=2004506 RepID=UPI003D6A4DEA
SCTGTCGTLQYSLDGGTPQASNVFTGLAPGTYTVVTSNVGAATCSDTQTITINAGVAVCTTPPTAAAGADGTTCPSGAFVLSGSASNGTIIWTTSGTGTFSNNAIANPTYTPSAADNTAGSVTLTITVTGIDACADETATDNMALSIIDAPAEIGCVANVNVTLGAECTATITPQMVVTGNIGCADNIIVTVDGGNTNVISGCGEHTYMVEVIEDGVVVYTCWGNLFAEDKTDPVVECPANTSSVTMDYDADQVSGTLEATDPLLNFNNYSCLNQGQLLDGEHNYDVVTFTTPDFAIPVDVYTMLMDSDW